MSFAIKAFIPIWDKKQNHLMIFSCDTLDALKLIPTRTDSNFICFHFDSTNKDFNT